MKVVTITGGQMNSIQTGELVFIDFYSQETYKYIFNVKIIEFCDFFMKLSVVNSKNKKIPDTLVNSEDYSSGNIHLKESNTVIAGKISLNKNTLNVRLSSNFTPIPIDNCKVIDCRV